LAENISPLGSVPQLPEHDFSFVPLAVLTVIAAALTALGAVGFARRDVG
jgi:ABC-2 type transport system permease protein